MILVVFHTDDLDPFLNLGGWFVSNYESLDLNSFIQAPFVSRYLWEYTEDRVCNTGETLHWLLWISKSSLQMHAHLRERLNS